MSYEKQTWQTGDVVTSAKLNHMEDGIAAGGDVFVVHYDGGTSTSDKSLSEIMSAISDGYVVILVDEMGYWHWMCDAGGDYVSFQSMHVGEDKLWVSIITVTASGWSGDFSSYTLTPVT